MSASSAGLRSGDLLLALALAGLTLVLSAAAYARAERAPPGRVPIGILADPHLVHMGAIYGSFAREALEGGGPRVHNHQTSEPHAAALLRPWDFVVGRLGRLVASDARGLFHVERCIAVVAFALGLALFFGEHLRRRGARALALIAAFTGASLYWLPELVGRERAGALRTWLDAWWSNLSGLGFAYPALLLGAPHLALEVALFAAALALQLAAARTRSLALALGAGGAAVWLELVRPYTLPIVLVCAVAVFAPLALAAGGRRRALAQLALAVLPPLPFLVHVRAVLSAGSVFAGLAVAHPSPPPHEQLLFLGLPVLGALALLLPGVRARRAALRLGSAAGRRQLVAWGLANALLVNAAPSVPWEVEAFLPLPLYALSLAALAAEPFAARTPRALIAAAALLALHALGTAVWARDVCTKLADPGAAYWLTSDEARLVDELERLSPQGSLGQDRASIAVLAQRDLALLLPWLAGVRAALGHPDHTVDAATKEAFARAYYRDGQGLRRLQALGVTHLVLGPREERAWRGGSRVAFDLRADPRLEALPSAGSVRLFALRPR